MNRTRTKRMRGMTLVEVMASLAITTVMLLGVVSTVLGAKRMVARGNVHTVATQLARARLDRILLAPRNSAAVNGMAAATLPTAAGWASSMKTTLSTVTAPTGTYLWSLDPESGDGTDVTRGAFFASDGTPIPTSSISPTPTACKDGPKNALCREIAVFKGVAGGNPTADSAFTGTQVPDDQVFTVYVRVSRVGDANFAVLSSQVVSR